MRIISRYLLRSFIIPLLAGICIFSVLFLLEQFFERLDIFLMHKANILHILQYLFFRLPYWVTQFFPVTILLGILFSLSKLSANNEISILKSVGISPYRLLSRLFFFIVFLSGLVFFLDEYVVPLSNASTRYVLRVKIEKANPENKWIQEKFVLIGKERKFFTIDYFDGKKGVIRGIGIDQYDENFRLVRHIYAKEANWKDNKWIYHNGIIREFVRYGETRGSLPDEEKISEEKFTEKVMFLPEKIEDFLMSEKKTDEMNFVELKKYILRLNNQGLPARREKVQYHLKFAYPASCIVMFFLGLPFALSLRRTGRLRSFALSLGVAFIYWGVLSVGRVLGESGYLSPILSAWSANITFLFIGLILFSKIPK